MQEAPSTCGPTIAALLAAQAREKGDEPALLSVDGQVISYREVTHRAMRVARALETLGVVPHQRVAVVVPNGVDAAIGMLGAMCGTTCAPLNPGYQRSELDFYLGDLDARAIVVGNGSPAIAYEAGAARAIPVLELDSVMSGHGDPSAGFDKPPAMGDVALVLHTSGTTARPKQVPLTHENLVASTRNIVAALRLAPGDRTLNVMPLFHIHGLMACLLAPLASGGSTVCARALELPAFFGWLTGNDVTWYSAVPTMHQAIVAAAERTVVRRPRRPLRFVRSSSAALAPPILARLESLFACPVIEAYGMTEAAHQMASNPLPPRPRKAGSVGVAAGPEMAVLDELGVPVGTGMRGEIAIRGDNVMRAYHANPEANLRAFTAGWFRTGDEGFFDADGYLYLTGRLKEIINRGGEKISPREIDEALLAQPEVAQAVAFAVPHPTLGEDVVAAVVLKASAKIDEVMLRHRLFETLADFKVPSELLVVDEIPTGATGKIQRIGLGERLHPYRQRTYAAPRTALEKLIAEVWCEVLERDALGVHDNFFALGGDSLKATRVVARLIALLAIQLPNAVLFRHPSVAELAILLERTVSPDVLAQVTQAIDDITNETFRRRATSKHG